MTPSSALAFDLDTEQMIIESDLLGPLEVAADELYRFPQGLFGFPDCHEFILVGAERPGLYWLQSTEFPALAFVTVDPFSYFDGYVLDLPTPDLRDLRVGSPDDVLVLAIVTLPGAHDEPPTANLQGPVAFNVRSRLAKQVVLENSPFGTRCPFELDHPQPA